MFIEFSRIYKWLSGALAPRMGKVGLWKQNELPYDTISQPTNKRNISILT